LRNVEVIAEKDAAVFGLSDYGLAARQLLSLSTVKNGSATNAAGTIPESEAEMLGVWMDMWTRAYLASP
jgi:hypothetical protein